MTKMSLSVILPNYNHAHYIGDALGSIFSQSFRPLEVIVVDDGSTDDSVAVIERLAKREPSLRLLRNKRNFGPTFSVNRALEHASGDYVSFQSADDKVLPLFFERSMRLLAEYPQAGLCCSDPASFTDSAGSISENRLRWSDKPCYFSPDNLATVIKGGYIAGHTSLIKRTAVWEAGGLIPDLRWHNDWFAWLVIAFRYGICYIPAPLAAIRVSANSYSGFGRRQWSLQRQVLNQILHLLKSPAYRDVLPLFARSGVLSHFGSRIVRVVLSNPEHWDLQSFRLIRRPLWKGAEKVMRRVAPSLVKALYRRIRDRERRTSRVV